MVQVTVVWIVKLDGHVLGTFTSREFAEAIAGKYEGSEVEERTLNRVTEADAPKRTRKPKVEKAEQNEADTETAAE